MAGVDRYFFDAYYRRVHESSAKELVLKGSRKLNMGQYGAIEKRLDTLGKGFAPKAIMMN